MKWTILLATIVCTLLPLSPAFAVEQAVIVHFEYGSIDLTRLFVLEDKIDAALKASGAGEFDGDEMAVDGSHGTLYMYGQSADRLFDAVEPILKTADFMSGAEAIKRYGPANSSARETSTIMTQD